MGIEYKIDVEAGVIFAVGSEIIGAKEIAAFRERLISDPHYRPGLFGIIDLQMAQLNFSGAEARQLASWAANKKPVKKLAIVVGSDSYGFARMYQGWAERGQDLCVFNDMESAREWLGLQIEDDP
ncbi:MAG: hypothetical protein O7A08_00775 [SAR324 cluster bacterium]|nr:hypothetical protein [SAR324 cluster bacterium]MCZ6646516.1 hypothetical protein [SAR324 cluster bacterium]